MFSKPQSEPPSQKWLGGLSLCQTLFLADPCRFHFLYSADTILPTNLTEPKLFAKMVIPSRDGNQKKREQKMSENRVMTEAEMAMARATGARVVSIEKPKTSDEALLLAEIIAVRGRITTLATALNTSHNLSALGWNIEDTLSLATKFVELRQSQVEELAKAVKELEIASTKLGLMAV